MGIVRLSTTIIKTIAKNKKVSLWRYKDLDETPWLYGSEYLRTLTNDAIKFKDKENLGKIVKYIKRFSADDVNSYKYILKKIAKHIDISDFF